MALKQMISHGTRSGDHEDMSHTGGVQLSVVEVDRLHVVTV